MKTIIKRFFLIASIAVLSVTSSFGQFKVVSDILKGGPNDANALVNAYLNPFGKAMGYNLAGGWYNTAKPHGLFGFDLTLTLNMATIPDAGKTFDISTLGLETITPSSPTNTIFPTVLNGNDVNSITIIERNPMTGEDEVLLPDTPLKGFGMPVIPMPILSGSIGLIKNTDLAFRYIPNVKVGALGTMGLWGVGVKHDILQWLPIVDKIPFINASAFLGYSKLNYNFEIDDVKNQNLNAELGAFHGALLVGVNVPFVAPYISVGLTSSNMKMAVLGDFDFIEMADNGEVTTTTLQDPLDLEFTNPLTASIAAGLRLKFGLFTIHGQYTYQEYSMITAGVGISFR